MSYKVVLRVTGNVNDNEYAEADKNTSASAIFDEYYQKGWIEEIETNLDSDLTSKVMTFYMDSEERWNQYVEAQQQNLGEGNVNSNFDYEYISKEEI